MATATIEFTDGENGEIKIRVSTGPVRGGYSRAQSLALGLADGAKRSGLAVEVLSPGVVSLGKVSVN